MSLSESSIADANRPTLQSIANRVVDYDKRPHGTSSLEMLTFKGEL